MVCHPARACATRAAMTDEPQRIRSYLLSQGVKLTPAAIVEKVQAAMAELHQAALDVPPARFGERPEPAEWSANEVMAHVVAAGRYFGGAVEAIVSGQPLPARLEGQGIENAPLGTADEWWEILQGDRARLFARAMAADPFGALDRTVEHQMFGPLDWRAALLFNRLHDLDHAGQLRKIADAFAGR